jgi:hypothetical protein
MMKLGFAADRSRGDGLLIGWIERADLKAARWIIILTGTGESQGTQIRQISDEDINGGAAAGSSNWG